MPSYRRPPRDPDNGDVFGGGPPRTTSTTDAPEPLGVPEGYTAPFTRGTEPLTTADAAARRAQAGLGPGTIGAQQPRYYDGDQYKPASLSPAAIAELQRQMAAAGLLDDFRYGVWDKSSQDAYKLLLSEANASGLTKEAQLAQRLQSVTIGGRGGRGGYTLDENGDPVPVVEPLQLRTTNKDDLRRVFRTAVIDKLGKGWSQQQIDEMADLYNQREIAMQRSQYDQALSGAPVQQVEDVPSPQAFAEQQMLERDPTGVKEGNFINDVMPAFLQALGGYV